MSGTVANSPVWPPFVFVTGNPGKLREAERVADGRFEHIALDLPEIQSLDLRTVLEAKADAAWQALGRPLLVDDTGLELDALGGFPGPLIKWLLDRAGVAGISRIATRLGSMGATARCGLLYSDGERRIYAEAAVSGTIVRAPRGDRGFGWDTVFQPAGAPGTYAELDDATKDAVGHRGKAWRSLALELARPGR